jgi:hypothetical protein
MQNFNFQKNEKNKIDSHPFKKYNSLQGNGYSSSYSKIDEQYIHVYSFELNKYPKIPYTQNHKLYNMNDIKNKKSFTNFIAETEDCSICLEDIKYCVQLKCGHNFCSECIINLWEYDNNTDCPYCRQSFNIEKCGMMSKSVNIKDKLNFKLESQNNKRLKSKKKDKPKRTRAEKRLLRDLNKSYCKN